VLHEEVLPDNYTLIDLVYIFQLKSLQVPCDSYISALTPSKRRVMHLPENILLHLRAGLLLFCVRPEM